MIISTGSSQSKREVYTVEPTNKNSYSSAANFCRVLGVITWIGGLIVAIGTANVMDLHGDTHFSFMAFLASAIIYGIAGGMLFCLAELFTNVQSIANSLKGLRVMGEAIPAPAAAPKEAAGTSAYAASAQAVQPGNQDAEAMTKKAFDLAKIKTNGLNTDALVEELKQTNVEWVEASELGDLGQRMVDCGLFSRERIYAPEGMSQREAEARGFGNYIVQDGEARSWRVSRKVPALTEEQLDALLDPAKAQK